MHHPAWGLFEILVFGLSLAALLAYFAAAVQQTRRGRGWSGWRTASFSSGILLLVIALLPQVVTFAHHDLRGHMVQHLLLGMFAPLALVLGAPVTLTLRICTRRAGKRLVAFLRNPIVRFASYPVVAMVLNIGGMYLLYLTPLYLLMLDSPVLHGLVHWHFLVAGCIFTWAIAGPDPAPHRPSKQFRLVVVFISMASHAFLAKAMYAYGLPDGTAHTAEEIKSAAKIMYYGGDLAELMLVIALFSNWFGRRGKRSPRALSVAPLRSVEPA